jgi:hypothetical protein
MLFCCLSAFGKVAVAQAQGAHCRQSTLEGIDSLLHVYDKVGSLCALGTMTYSEHVRTIFEGILAPDAILVSDYDPSQPQSLHAAAFAADMKAQYPEGLVMRLVREKVVWISADCDSALVYLQRQLYGNHVNGCRYEILSDLNLWLVRSEAGMKLSMAIEMAHEVSAIGCEDVAAPARKRMPLSLYTGFSGGISKLNAHMALPLASATEIGPDPLTADMAPQSVIGMQLGIGIPVSPIWEIGMQAGFGFGKTALTVEEIVMQIPALDPSGLAYARLVQGRHLREQLACQTYLAAAYCAYRVALRRQWTLILQWELPMTSLRLQSRDQAGVYDFAAYYASIPVHLTDSHPHATSLLQSRDISSGNSLDTPTNARLRQTSFGISLHPQLQFPIGKHLALRMGVQYTKLIGGRTKVISQGYPLRDGVLGDGEAAGLSSLTSRFTGMQLGLTAGLAYQFSLPQPVILKF